MIFKILYVSALLLAMAGCGYVSADAGHEKVLIEKPMFFGHGGVDPEPVRTGRQVVAATTDDVDVIMQPQQFQIHVTDLMTSDGVPLTFDSIIRVRVTDSVMLVKSFGPEWYKNNIEAEFLNRVRQAVRKHGMNETAISTIAIDAIDQEITQAMQQHIERSKIPLELLKVTVGKANPPDAIKNQRVETATQQQRILSEQQRKLAEDQRKAAEASRAAADNAYREEMQLSPDQFLRLEQIKMQGQVCAHAQCTFLFGGGASPVIPVGR